MLGEFQFSEDSELTVTLGMMTKYWEEGCVKTRLGRATGNRVAAKIHELFTHCNFAKILRMLVTNGAYASIRSAERQR